MPETTVKEQAEQAVKDVLSGAQSSTMGDMSASQASLKVAHNISVFEDDRTARRTGRRPLFRGINLAGVP